MFQSAFFDRDDVALSGFSKFFSEQSEEENEHARHFIKYQNMRGGRVVFQDVPKPATDDWESALAAAQAALTLEKKVNQVHLFSYFLFSLSADYAHIYISPDSSVS